MDRSDTTRRDDHPTADRWKSDHDDTDGTTTKHRSSRRRDDKDHHRTRDREKSKVNERDRRKEDEFDRTRDNRDREKHRGRDKEKSKDRVRDNNNNNKVTSRNNNINNNKDEEVKSDSEDGEVKDNVEADYGGGSKHSAASSDIQDRIMRMKEERLKKKSEEASDVLSWVSKSRKLEEKRNVQREKVLYLSKVFEEQDNVTQEDEDEPPTLKHSSRDLAEFKVLDGLDKVIEGGAVVLTLKDQDILADGDINQGVDMLENVDIGEQKRRNEAYKAAKKTGVYDDKFNEYIGFEKKMLPQYDDPVVNEGVTLDERGRFSGEAEKN